MTFVFVETASEGAPGTPNQDLCIVRSSFVVVLDGVTPPRDGFTGCSHGVASLLADGSVPLGQALASAIGQVRDRHGAGCDLSHPDTPAAAVALLRERGDRLEYLVLCDCAVVLDGPQGVLTVTDDRTGHLP